MSKFYFLNTKIFYLSDHIGNFFHKSLPNIVLRIGINRIKLTNNSIKSINDIIFINFFLLSKKGTSHPFVFKFFERRFDFHQDS